MRWPGRAALRSYSFPGPAYAVRPLVAAHTKELPMPTGTVKFFNTDKGYGFIAPEDGGNDAFVHISAVERAGLRTLDKDQRITYELELDKRGKQSAVNIQTA